MTRVLTVLYEDQSEGVPNNYGPHRLVMACVADRDGKSPWKWNACVHGVPKKGNTKLLQALKKDGPKLADRGPVIAVFDDDQIRGFIGLPGNACKREVIARLMSGVAGEPQVVLLVDNMESVINACCDALGRARPTRKPTPSDRDHVLQATVTQLDPSGREKIVAAVPSLRRLIEHVAGFIATLPQEIP